MAAIKLARIIAAAAVTLGFAASCGQLLGDFVVETRGNLPSTGVPDAAAPVPIICEEGVTACDGRALQLCTDGGTAWATLEVCETADLCASSDSSTVATCLKPKCGLEQMSCEGNVLQLCNAMRTGWELFDTCESAAHCDAGNRQCLPAPCEPGSRRCNVGYLERCNDERTAWEPLDTCETNELCEVTLAPPAEVAEVLATSQLPAPASNDEGPIECRSPVCIPREVRCDDNRLMACNAGQTDLTLAEECGTPKLCEASITYTGLRGSPRCVRPACADGEHRCTETGVLEVCNPERDGFVPIAVCVGSPFCNAVAADNGQPGCEDAPCDPGEMQCNGPQIQVCRNDQTAFEALGAACETRGLCNDDNPAAAFCQAPVCQRGPFSGTEFRCQGASLLRCNDQHTAYDSINSCATPGLCNAALGFNGCQAPVCAPGETRCSGNFVQRCNDQRTGFDNIEQCSAGTCDSSLGRCADPCVLGSARCNAQGNLEECRNLLVGREITARCGSPQLCDATARQCRTPPAGCTADGVRRCRSQGQNTVLEECTDGRSRFATLDTCDPSEVCDLNDIRCDACQQGSEPTCEGNNLVSCSANGQTESVTACPNGCQPVTNGPDRCRNCVPGAVSCEGSQLVVCRQRNGTEVPDREQCVTNALCQATIASCTGEACRCETSECDVGQRQCNGSQPEICNAGQTGYEPVGPNCGALGCDTATGRCFTCAPGDVECDGGQLFGCSLDGRGFILPLGIQRCVSDNAGDRTQSCDDDDLVDIRCTGASSVCIEGAGCQECDPDVFQSTCVNQNGEAARTECVAGDVQTRTCESASGCVDAVCQGAGFCNTASSARGTACTRPGGGGGFCNGAPSAPSCVECTFPNSTGCGGGRPICSINDTCVQCVNVSDCVNDTNECTGLECSQGTCQFPDRDGEACSGGAGTCNGATCTLDPVCDPDETRCRGDLFEVCNAGRTGFDTLDNCAPGVCTLGGCRDCDSPDDCDDDGNPCTGLDCSLAGVCQAPPLNTGSCPAAGGLPGTCSNGVCNADPIAVCDPGETRCSGDLLQACNAGLTDFETIDNCAPGTCLPNPDRCVACNDSDDCEDNNDCTADECSTVGTCEFPPQGGDCTAQGGVPGTCNAGSCVPIDIPVTVCQPNETRCAGDVAQICSADRTEFDNVETCDPGLCDPQFGCVQCTSRENCPQPPECNAAVCTGNGQCATEPIQPPGSPCSAGQCDGDGNCLPIQDPDPPPTDPTDPPEPPGDPQDPDNSIFCNDICTPLLDILCPSDCDDQ